jgi:branched-chain amino acid transport system permease protein
VLALDLQLAAPGSCQLPLSLYLLAGVVIGGLGSLTGAIWGAAFLVLLPGWANNLGHSFSLSTKVYANLPLAIYGAVLILAMLVWPTGIQGAVRLGATRLQALVRSRRAPALSAPAEEESQVSVDEPRVVS